MNNVFALILLWERLTIVILNNNYKHIIVTLVTSWIDKVTLKSLHHIIFLFDWFGFDFTKFGLRYVVWFEFSLDILI